VTPEERATYTEKHWIQCPCCWDQTRVEDLPMDSDLEFPVCWWCRTTFWQRLVAIFKDGDGNTWERKPQTLVYDKKVKDE
jgi:hypothetical protein